MAKYRVTIHYSRVVEAESEEDAMDKIKAMWQKEVNNADEGDYIVAGRAKTEIKYKCLICNEIFDTKTGKGKMHMAGHGYSLEGALAQGKAKILEA